MTSNRMLWLLALLSTLVFGLLQLYDPPLVRDHIESKTYDFRLQLRNRLKAPQPRGDIVIVAIDEQSLAEVGRWPWSRGEMARLLRGVAAGRPKVIGVDIMFSEREGKEADAALGAAVAEAGNVVLAAAFLVGESSGAPAGEVADTLWDAAFMAVKPIPGIPWKDWAVTSHKALPPIPEIAGGATLGHVTTQVDLDGILRRELLYVRFGDDCYPSLSLQIARIAAGLPMSALTLAPGGAVGFGDRDIPTDLSGRVLIDYLGREGTFRTLSAADLLAGRVPAATLKDAVVLIGTSALATYDQKVTPFSANLPGVEKNASVVQNLLGDGFLRQSPGIVELAVIVLSGALLAWLLPRLGGHQGVLCGVLVLGGYLIATFVLLAYRDIWLNLVYPTANMVMIFSVATVTRLVAEERKARQIRTMFSSYVSPKIVETLIAHPERLALGGERREATILFSDMIGFTTLSEKLPPEDVVAILNEYYLEMAEIIFRWDGTLDKFVGDEIMALWNAPIDQPNHAELAVRCALHMSDRLDQLRVMWQEKGHDLLDCGIGLNTGEVLIGNVGLAGKKMDYTAIGNHVNVAARLEKLTRNYPTRIIIGENTLTGIAAHLDSGRIGHVEVEELGGVKVKGKDEEVKIYALRSLPCDQKKSKDD